MKRLTAEDLKARMTTYINTTYRLDVKEATEEEVFYALAAVVNEQVKPLWDKTNERYKSEQTRQVYYLSMEFLIGRLIESNLLNLGMLKEANQALQELGFQAEDVFTVEQDAALGNGGLGRLAACFLDSLASLNYPGHGYGIRYRYGLFEQRIIHGNQVELPDYWLKKPYPWEVRREEEACVVQFQGIVRMHQRRNGSLEINHEHTDKVLAVPYDVPVIGYENETVNTLRLWSAEPVSGAPDNSGDQEEFYHHLDFEHSIEQLSGFLYPDDSSYEGKELRLKQQYFLVSASVQNMIKQFKKNYRLSSKHFPEKIVIQINDTHPSLSIPELMRILMDEEDLGWDEAWEITTRVFAYTNHTTLSEALETWPIAMMQKLLPRIYMIIDEINERFCQGIWFDHKEKRDKIPELAIIADEQVHMARLAIVASFSVNGVANIHTEILKKKEMKEFHELYPERFNNKTNGITHRRWLMQVNPKLTSLIQDIIGDQWVKRPKQLISLLRFQHDKDVLEQFAKVKNENKLALANFIHQQMGITVDDQSIFDVQIKRLHEYKRQLLNVFHIIYLYNELKENPNLDMTPRTFIFGAKAAPSYHLAKEVIKLINTVASIVNYDKDTKGKLKVIFLENYNVSLAEKIIPAAEISEQISTASKEASGTGNMKFMMNGALTMGTMDGANVEIYDLVGEENMFIFGLRAEEVLDYYQHGGYHARDIYNKDDRVRRILDQLNNGEFGTHDIEFKDIYYNILYHNDPYFVLKDFEPYIEAHEYAESVYRDKMKWQRMSLINIAHSGKFSSDRTIQEYVNDIWKINPT
ncbi:glycogen/starch/alpha-glucan phosphorylase [Oceanobacillus indicireducens]|uniref:Alpha-1,4 glucan phosphorylase n=1 Tax=Oceanobacillus indicireducens TaxID=1004261 RepID=A0A917XW97_9BACI|nr:alpha-1,4 glucan phosphorylase [Oceanobacillus indicireducens]